MTLLNIAKSKTNGYLVSFFSDPWYKGFLLLSAGLVVFLIVFVKSRTVSDVLSDPLILGYTYFVTAFQLSRLTSAVFYKPAYNRISYTKENEQAIANNEYEPHVSFVIPCKNEQGAIEKTITQCFLADYPREKIEVIIVNDGSTDNTLDIIMEMKRKFPDLVVVNWRKNRGKRFGMAEGFRRAQGEIIIQLDSDSYIVPETFRKLIEPFANEEIGAICAHADPENADDNIVTKMQAAYYFMSFRILKAAESTYYTVFCCSGCSSAYRKSAVLPILDTWLGETFLGLPVTWGDDRALTNWVLKNDYRTIYTDEARARTIVPETLRQFIKQQIRWKKGWFVNSIFAGKFIWKKEPFVAFTYFFPLMIVTLLTPIMATRALFYTPFARTVDSTIFYVAGVLLIGVLIVIYYRMVSRDNKYWPYIFVWSAINMVILSFLLFYALATIQNRKWGTR